MRKLSPVSSEKLLPLLIFLVTGIVFLPVLNWLLNQTMGHEQLLHAFLVFLLSCALLVYERRIALPLVWQFSDISQNLLIFSYALLVVAIFTKFSLIILASLCLSIGSFLWFMFGKSQSRLIISGLGAFSLFSAIAAFLPVMDWPLRTIAGKWAAFGLNLFGQNVELGLLKSDSGPMLMLISNSKPFHVAAECNGFGMLGSSLLMATIILLYVKLPLFDRLGWLVISVFLGLFFNIIRIIIIVLLAKDIPSNAYMLMHEAVGLLTTYGGLAIIYFLLMPANRNKDVVPKIPG